MKNLMSCTDFRRALKPWTPCSCLGMQRLLLIPGYSVDPCTEFDWDSKVIVLLALETRL